MAASKKQQRWYLGGMGACMAVVFTHPLDTIKVHLQTQKGMLLIYTTGIYPIYFICSVIFPFFLVKIQETKNIFVIFCNTFKLV